MLIVYNDMIIGADNDSIIKFFGVDMCNQERTNAVPPNGKMKTDELVKDMFIFPVPA